MKTLLACTVLLTASIFAEEIPNPDIDYPAFMKLANDLEPVRAAHRVTEDDFIKMSSEPGAIILDARTLDRYENIHVKGARHLALTDFTEAALRTAIPDKTTRILIYCNNNFLNEPGNNFNTKSPPVALNIQTFINLHAYGYKNVYELGPRLDVKTAKIPFEGKTVEAKK